MKISGVILNDFTAAPGVCVTLFCQGCPHHCPGCHNPETWDFNGGYEFTASLMNKILKAIVANGIMRSFCIMGGEPMCDENLKLTYYVVKRVRERYPDIKIYIWTGYTMQELRMRHLDNKYINKILNEINVIIDGRYIKELRDVTLPMRGSSNQKIYRLTKK